LESVCTVTGTVGSNPTVSAKFASVAGTGRRGRLKLSFPYGGVQVRLLSLAPSLVDSIGSAGRLYIPPKALDWGDGPDRHRGPPPNPPSCGILLT
jgi:hypothetical protein